MKGSNLLLTLLLGAVCAAALAQPLAAQTPATTAPTATGAAALPDAAAGLALFQEHCADCHGPFGRGDGTMVDRLPAPPPSFADAAVIGRSSPDAALEIITNGRLDKLMPPWKDKLSAEERLAVLYGAWSWYYTPERLVAGRSAWEESCGSCHGPTPGAAGRPAFDGAWWRSRSQDDAAAGWADATAHAAVGPLDDETLRRALDFARANSFEALPFRELKADGSIAGRVTNGSAGAAGAAGATVSLIPFHAAVPGILPGRPISATLGVDGSFRFTGLLSGPDLNYHVLTRYQGADSIVPQAIALGGDGPTEATVDATVFESSPTAPLRARLAQMVLAPRPEDGEISVAEAWTLVNDGDRTRIGAAGQPVLSFKVPATASQIVFDDPGQQAAATITEGELHLDYPLPPGERTVLFSYSLPYAGRSVVLESRWPVAVDHFELMAIGADVAIESEQLGALSRETRGEESIAMVKADGLAEGSAWTARLIELPAPTGAAPVGPTRLRGWGPSMNGGNWLGLGLTVLVLGVLGFNMDRRRRTAAFQRAGERLVATIADLDGRWERGDLGEAAYRRQRAAWVGQALALPALPDLPSPPRSAPTAADRGDA